MKTLSYVIFTLLLFVSSCVVAQNNPSNTNKTKKEEKKKANDEPKDIIEQQLEEFEKAIKEQEEDFDKQSKKQAQTFRDFKQKLDEDFANHLKESWKKFTTNEPKKTDVTPKPVETPVVNPTEVKNEEPRKVVNVEVIKPNNEIPTQDKPQIPSILKFPVEPVNNPKNDPTEEETFLSVNFFDEEVAVPYNDDFHVALPIGQIHGGIIADYWGTMAKKDYLYFIQQVLKRRIEMQLNDWAYYHLLKSIGEKVSQGNKNETILFTWFMLNQSGYKAKVGYEANKDVYLLLPSNSIIYRTAYYIMPGNYYYVIDGKQTRMELDLYPFDYPDAKNVIRLDILKDLKISDKTAYRNINFKYLSKDYSFKIAYNPNAIKLFEDYPLTDLNIFFTAKPTAILAQSLKENLEPHLKGKSETEAINFLLAFVQKGFEYKTDQEQFDREKTFFVEEIIYYPFTDCEDRSVFFAYLVRELLGMEVIGLDYPGHVATAVKFSTEIVGDYCMYEGQKYIICDPTYIGASLGMEMDQVKNTTPEVVVLKGK
jgi:hypothetical protein